MIVINNEIECWTEKCKTLWSVLNWEASIPVTARSKSCVCSSSLPGIVDSNPARGMVVSLLWVLCVLRVAYHSSRWVLPTVVRRCVWSRKFNNEQATVRVGSQRHREENIRHNIKFISTFLYCNCNSLQYVKLRSYCTASLMATCTEVF